MTPSVADYRDTSPADGGGELNYSPPMADDTSILVGAGDANQCLLLKYGNRHGLVAGATGTGKTVSLQTVAEGFSAAGVPVFMADVKGDLSGIAAAGGDNRRGAIRCAPP